MPTYQNADAYARTWTSLTAADGTTLHLQPGETADLTLDAEQQKAVDDDPYLKPVAAPKQKPADTSTPAASKE